MKQLLLLLLIPIYTCAQELVPDPGFEALRNCPGGISMLNYSVLWYSPTAGTPDLFNRCSRGSQVGVPKNICGRQKPFEGNGYAGLILYEFMYLDYKEYLQTQLIRPLEEGAVYKLAFHISLSDESMYAIDVIQAVVSEEPIQSNKPETITGITPDITFRAEKEDFFTDKKHWTLLTAEFTAKGGEQFLTIGNFIPALHGRKKKVSKNSSVESAYYYVDGISFIKVRDGGKKKKEEVKTTEEKEAYKDTLAEGSSFILKNILFETDKDVLMRESYTELEKVLVIMKKYPLMEIEVRGHTDDQASEEHNLDLSERRAKAVASYLESKGINRFRLTTKGFGESMPIAGNETEEGRALNRRVEFYIRKR
jgi:OmpA-OmpF porin, OOP family